VTIVTQIKSSLAIDVDLPVDIFDAQVNIPLIHQVVVAQLAAARQGTHSTLRRGEVAGGGKKPHRQKGTGRARQGSTRAPHMTGGGVVHGPKPRDYDQRTPKKVKAAALRGALSDRARNGRMHVVDSLVGGDAPSTKTAVATLRGITERPRVLVVIEREDANTFKSLRNIADVALLSFDQLNTYDVLKSDDVVFTKAAFDAFVAARSAEGADTVKLSKAVVVDEKKAKAPAKQAPAKKAPAANAAKPSAAAKKAPAKKAPAKKAPAAKKDES
jgi:large subunit ribosomal protein L4